MGFRTEKRKEYKKSENNHIFESERESERGGGRELERLKKTETGQTKTERQLDKQAVRERERERESNRKRES